MSAPRGQRRHRLVDESIHVTVKRVVADVLDDDDPEEARVKRSRIETESTNNTNLGDDSVQCSLGPCDCFSTGALLVEPDTADAIPLFFESRTKAQVKFDLRHVVLDEAKQTSDHDTTPFDDFVLRAHKLDLALMKRRCVHEEDPNGSVGFLGGQDIDKAEMIVHLRCLQGNLENALVVACQLSDIWRQVKRAGSDEEAISRVFQAAYSYEIGWVEEVFQETQETVDHCENSEKHLHSGSQTAKEEKARIWVGFWEDSGIEGCLERAGFVGLGLVLCSLIVWWVFEWLLDKIRGET